MEAGQNKASILKELAWLFLKLGSIAFGGPAAHIAMMEAEVVRHRKWLTHEAFLDLVGATNLIPGPNSTELAIHIGYRRAGWAGLLVAGACFILPAMLIVMAIAWAYTRFGALPQVQGLLYGIKPVIIAIVAQALWNLVHTAVKNKFLGLVGIMAFSLSAFGVHELLVLLGAGILVPLCKYVKRSGSRHHVLNVGPALLLAQAVSPERATVFPIGIGPLFFFFLKTGSVLFGSGYVLLAFLQGDLVHRWGWLTQNQLLDAITVGQITPGPVFTTATFIGYILAGPGGAVASTIGIFLPAFLFVALSSPFIPKMRQSALFSNFLDGVNVASLALMAAVTLTLGRVALIDVPTVLLLLVSGYFLIQYRVNSAILIGAGALIGLLSHNTFIKLF